MVQVNKIGKNKPASTPPAKDAGTADASLIQSNTTEKQLATIAKNAKLPAFLQKDDRMPGIISPELTGYVGFADHRSKNWNALQAAGIEAGDPYICKDGQYHLCKPLQFHLLAGRAFKTCMEGQEGTFIFVTSEVDTPAEVLFEHLTKKEQDRLGIKKFKELLQEHYVCLMVVYHQNQLIPIKADFRGTKKSAAESPVRAIEEAASPDWLKKSDAHRITAAYPEPSGRVFVTVDTHFKVGKSSGNGFYVAQANCQPSTIEQMKSLLDAYADEDFMNQLNEAHSNYESRIEFLESVAISCVK